MASAGRPRKGTPRKGPHRLNYKELAAHHGVDRRTVVRWVVAGQIPSPILVGSTCYWSGEDLVRAMEQPGFPGSYEFTPSKKEALRRQTIKRKVARNRSQKAKSNTSVKKEVVK